MRKIILNLAVILTVIGTAAYFPTPMRMKLSEKESAAMLNEADDYIDEIAEGQQDRQADAIYHSLHGTGGELAALRERENKDEPVADGVVRKDIAGEGETRGIKMRLYSPSSPKGKLPLLVFFHGGGWTTGGINSSAEFCDAVAATGDALVLAADYSSAPEAPYPAPVEDAGAIIRYAIDHAGEFGSSPELVSIGGESSGANIALSALFNEEESGKVKSMVLFYPIVKVGNDRSSSWKEYSRGYGLDGRLMEAYTAAYLSNGSRNDDPGVSPALAEDSHLKSLPPVLMVSAERDILSDQGKEFAEHLEKLGVKTVRIELPGTVHGFISKEGQPTAFRKSVELTRSFLK